MLTDVLCIQLTHFCFKCRSFMKYPIIARLKMGKTKNFRYISCRNHQSTKESCRTNIVCTSTRVSYGLDRLGGKKMHPLEDLDLRFNPTLDFSNKKSPAGGRTSGCYGTCLLRYMREVPKLNMSANATARCPCNRGQTSALARIG